MTIATTAFGHSPDGGSGLARDSAFAWRQRRAENNGNFSCASCRARPVAGRIPCSIPGCNQLQRRDGARHAAWRLTNSAYDGPANHPADALPGRLYGNREIDNSVHGHAFGHPGLDHPHHRRCDHRGGCSAGKSAIVERRATNCYCLGNHYAGGGDGGVVLRGCEPRALRRV